MKNSLTMLGLVTLLTFLGCATRHGTLTDGRSYQEYDVRFNADKGFFNVPLEDISFNRSTENTTKAQDRLK